MGVGKFPGKAYKNPPQDSLHTVHMVICHDNTFDFE